MTRCILKILIVIFVFAGQPSFGADDQDGTQNPAVDIASFSGRAIFNLDQDQLKAVLLSYLLNHPDIKGVRVTESLENEVLLTYVRIDDKSSFDVDIPENIENLNLFFPACFIYQV